ncbi:MAG: TonB-dependent receptor [Candidatus Dadabacteria bacterium]|nr:MAG: TonB-dependent receptor [Candidatus Dadabacteria bacterium]
MKALTVNLDSTIYGTFAEIGAGQEVVRHFFKVGAAAGTVASSISAYDMKFSDSIYKKAKRYVSRERLGQMLDREYSLLIERLNTVRGDTTRFFAFADTVATRSYKGNNECHGWLGIRFQIKPQSEPDDIIIHVRMLQDTAQAQQDSLGVIGVNLVYGAYFYTDNLDEFIRSLNDNLAANAVEVDMIEFIGPSFREVDNRLMSLKLVQFGLTNAIMFGPDRRVKQPSEEFYKRPVLLQRGSFRPLTNVNIDMIKLAEPKFREKLDPQKKDPITVLEITINNLLATEESTDRDFLDLADTLCAEGFNVLISDYPEYYRLATYLRRYTKEPIGITIGANALIHIFNENYYQSLPGGIMEAFGKLFERNVTFYIYPIARETFEISLLTANAMDMNLEMPEGEFVTSKNIDVGKNARHLLAHLQDRGYLVDLEGYNPEYCSILSTDIVALMRKGNPAWKRYIPPNAADIIEKRCLFCLKK